MGPTSPSSSRPGCPPAAPEGAGGRRDGCYECVLTHQPELGEEVGQKDLGCTPESGPRCVWTRCSLYPPGPALRFWTEPRFSARR